MRSERPASAALARRRSASLKACSGTRVRALVRMATAAGQSALLHWSVPSVERRLRDKTISSACPWRRISNKRRSRCAAGTVMSSRRERT